MSLRALTFLLSTGLLAAQNEVVFVGTSVGGSTDPHFFVSSGSGTVVSTSGNNFTELTLSLDPPANAADFTVSNGVRIVAGV